MNANPKQFNAIQCNTMQYNTVQYNTKIQYKNTLITHKTKKTIQYNRWCFWSYDECFVGKRRPRDYRN